MMEIALDMTFNPVFCFNFALLAINCQIYVVLLATWFFPLHVSLGLQARLSYSDLRLSRSEIQRQGLQVAFQLLQL
jgi:hypothetical protein